MDLLVVLIAVGLILASTGYITERMKWNGGISPFDGTPWKRFDMDSQGDRGYQDENGNVCWISWPFIDTDYKEES